MPLTKAQQLAVESIDKNVLVAAGAGSGKTRVLVERFVEILRQRPEVNVSQIMAVTYTRKAAGEMRTRLKDRIQKLVDETSDAERERWAECLFAIDSARIGTIHSVCESILRNFPAEACVDPQFEIVDDLERAELVQEAIDQSFREIIDEQGAEHILLQSFSLTEIERCLSTIINSSIEFNESAAFLENCSLDEFKTQLLLQLKHTQSQIINDIVKLEEWLLAHEHLRTGFLADPKNKLEPIRKQVLGLVTEIHSSLPLASRGNDAIIAQCWQCLLDIRDTKTATTGGNGVEAKAIRADIRALRELVKKYAGELPKDIAETDCADWQFITALIGLAKRALNIYQTKKEEIHKLDYNDLILRTFSALNEPDSPVRLYYRNMLNEILVDEFQDTNRTQAALLSYLTGPRTTLFLIGDDKQSIYKFQGADVSIFNEWHEYFRDNNRESLYENISITGERAVLSLGDSFRSHPNLVGFVNSIFKQLLGEEEVTVPYRARYRELIASRISNEAQVDFDADPRKLLNNQMQDRLNGGVEVISFDATEDGERSSAALNRQVESNLVANWIVEKINSGALVTNGDGSLRPIEYGDFGILVQRNSDCAVLEPALAERGIPYVAFTGKGFLDRQEVYDIENMLAFLANPLNDHALLAILRSPICSLTDDLIHNLVADKTEKIWTLLQQEAAKNRPGYQAVNRVVVVLKRFLADLPTKTLGEMVQSIVTASNYDLILMALPNGKQRSRNLWKLVNLATAHEQMTCAEFVHFLQAMRQYGVKQSDAPVDTSNAVKLMTIHAAKGLEFPAVILPVLQVSASSKKRRVLFHRQYGFAFNTARTKDDPKPLWYTLATLLDKDMELAEKKRLLYVAMTRARDYLAFFIDDDRKKEESFAQWLKPLLKLDGSDEENSSETRPFLQEGAELYHLEEFDPDGLSPIPGSSAGDLEPAEEFAPQVQSQTYTVKNSKATFSLTQYDAEALSTLKDNLPDLENSLREEAGDLLQPVVEKNNSESRRGALHAPANSKISLIDSSNDESPPAPKQLGILFNFAAPDESNRLDFSTGDDTYTESSRDIPSKTSPYRTDLLEPILTETTELSPVFAGWSRITPKPAEVEVDPRTLGTFFHALMEILPERRTMPDENELLAIVNLQGDMNAHPTKVKNLLQESRLLLVKFFNSDLHKMLLSAKQIFHELPYYKFSSLGSTVNRPDLLIETAESKWLIIDYKTDRFAIDAMAAQARSHSKQLDRYSKDLVSITGIRASKAIYFAQHGKLFHLDQLNSEKDLNLLELGQ